MNHHNEEDDLLGPFGVEISNDTPLEYVVVLLLHVARKLLPGVIALLLFQWLVL